MEAKYKRIEEPKLLINAMGMPILEYTRPVSEKKAAVSRGSENALKGYVEIPNLLSGNYAARGIIEKYEGLPYVILRRLSKNFIVVSMILRLRSDQIRGYSNISHNEEERGFRVMVTGGKDKPTSKEEETIREIEAWILNTGRRDFTGHEERTDDFGDVLERLTRDILSIDRVAISVRKDKLGEPVDFAVIDAATIKPIDRYTGFDGDKSVRYVQDIAGKVVEKFFVGEVYVDWTYKSSDISNHFYGTSPLEEAFREAKSTIEALKYNSGNFTTNKAPRGFFTINEVVDERDLDDLEARFNAMYTQSDSAFRTLFFAGTEMKYNPIQMSNREMEFAGYMQLLMTLIFANYSVDPAELGIRLDKSQSIFGDTAAGQSSDRSRDRGIVGVLSFIKRIINKVIHSKKEWAGYELQFTGTEVIDKDKVLESRIKELGAFKTINATRALSGSGPLEDELKESGVDDEELLKKVKIVANLPLSQVMYSGLGQLSGLMAQEGMGGGMDDGGGEEGEEEGDEEEFDDVDDDGEEEGEEEEEFDDVDDDGDEDEDYKNDKGDDEGDREGGEDDEEDDEEDEEEEEEEEEEDVIDLQPKKRLTKSFARIEWNWPDVQ